MARERDDLAAAFKRFTTDGHRFLKDFAASNALTVFRFAPEFEYEVKFSASYRETNPDKLLDRLVDSLKVSGGWVTNNYRAHSQKTPQYHTLGDIEYSTFSKDGKLIQKIKLHRALQVGNIVVMKSDEVETRNPLEIEGNLANSTYVGKLHKDRAKTYLLHAQSQTVYSLAVTHYSSGQRSRVQCELEYAGHLYERGGNPPSVLESSLLGLLSQLGQSLLVCTGNKLAVESETKMDFLIRSQGDSEELSA